MIRQRYILQNTTSEVMWSFNVTTIEYEGEKSKSSVFRWLHLSIDMILPCRCGALMLPIIRQRYILQNTTSEVMWSCNDTAIEHEGEKCKSSVFLEGTLDARGLNYVTSLGILILAEVGRRSCRR